jgi:hypothetical protein
MSSAVLGAFLAFFYFYTHPHHVVQVVMKKGQKVVQEDRTGYKVTLNG